MAASRPLEANDRWRIAVDRADLLAAARLALICAAAALCARLLFVPDRGGLLLFAPQLGLALGLLARRGRPTLPDAAAVLLAELAAALATSREMGAGSLVPILLHAAIPFACLLALRRFRIDLPACASVREYLAFVGVAGLAPAVVTMLPAAVLGTPPAWALLHGVGVGTGIVLCAPLLAFRGRRPLDAFRTPMTVTEGALLTAGFVLATGLVLWQSLLPLSVVWGAVLLWTALRHGFPPTCLLALLLWSLSLVLVLRGGAPAPADLLPLMAALERDLGLVVATGCILGVALDQERRLTTWAVARARELETLVRALPDLVFRLDREGRILDYRAGIPEDASVAPEAFLGRRITELLPTPAASVFAQAIDRALSSPEVVQFEYTLPAANGGPRHFEARLSALENGRLLLVVRDVTERARAEAELRARARALARSNAELQQFAYIASHDLQEPLRTVAGFCELLQRRYGDRLDDTGREFIAFAVDGARRMQSLVRDLLDLSRVATRGRPFEPVDCRAVVERVAADLQGALAEAGGEIEIGPLPTVRADGSQLAQLFANLIGNAIKYRGERPPRVRVWAERQGEGHLFHVEDNGIGIPPEFREQIFEAFRRLHTRDEYPGNGIGLAICKKIVARHGGWIRVRSTPGEGSDFQFWLPDDPDDPDEARYVVEPEAPGVSSSPPGAARVRERRTGASIPAAPVRPDREPGGATRATTRGRALSPRWNLPARSGIRRTGGCGTRNPRARAITHCRGGTGVRPRPPCGSPAARTRKLAPFEVGSPPRTGSRTPAGISRAGPSALHALPELAETGGHAARQSHVSCLERAVGRGELRSADYGPPQPTGRRVRRSAASVVPSDQSGPFSGKRGSRAA